MKPLYRRLIWLAIILVIDVGLPSILTHPVGAVYHLDGWLIPPACALAVMALVQWLVFLPIL